MTVKILRDPVLTLQEPSRCSTYVQFYTLANKLLAERQDIEALGRAVRSRWLADYSGGRGAFTVIEPAPRKGDYNNLLEPWKTFLCPPNAATELAETFAAFPCRYVHLGPKVPHGVEWYGGNFVKLDACQPADDDLGQGGRK